MSDRITHTDVERIAATVSERMPDYTLTPQRRNGYLGLDLYHAQGGMVKNLHIGTTREVYTYLQGMRRAQLLS
jgi:hypothetical protein